jgi:5-methyltetrahydrofolate--homocysteine methyltransferase
MSDLKNLYDAILNGDMKSAVALTQQAIADKRDPAEIINGTMIPAMSEVGRLYEEEEYFVPEMLLSARAMKGALELLRPLMASSGMEPTGRVIFGTVAGDLHDIGKNLVISMLEGAGFEVIDLGIDVTPQRFIDAIKEEKPHIIGMSALLTVTMPAIKTTIDAISAAGLRDGVKIMIGGAPVTAEYARQVGADGYSVNASAAVTVAKQMIGLAAA